MIDIHKKIIYYILAIMLCFSSVTGTVAFRNTNTNIPRVTFFNQNYSHTVFAGAVFSQTCGPCHNWSQNMYNAYDSGSYDFEYVSMVAFDENGQVLNYDALNWSNSYGILTEVR